MNYLIVLSLILSFNISVMQATCSKTFITATTSQSDDHNKPPPPISSALKDNVSNTDHLSLQKTSDSHQDAQVALNDLDNLRLEYNKYKILSHLGMTANPNEVAPRLTEYYDDVRSQIASRFKYNDDSLGQETNNKVVNMRHKRSLSCNQVKSNKDACCLESFYVNFTEIGWDKWILYPAGYNANYCRGQCDLSHARYYHSTLLSKFSNVIGLCCSPKQMAPLRLLYIDESNKVNQKLMPDMIVESCDCA